MLGDSGLAGAGRGGDDHRMPTVDVVYCFLLEWVV